MAHSANYLGHVTRSASLKDKLQMAAFDALHRLFVWLTLKRTQLYSGNTGGRERSVTK